MRPPASLAILDIMETDYQKQFEGEGSEGVERIRMKLKALYDAAAFSFSTETATHRQKSLRYSSSKFPGDERKSLVMEDPIRIVMFLGPWSHT